MKKIFLTLALLSAIGSVCAAELPAEYLKEPFNRGGLWINSSKQIMWKHPVLPSRPIQTSFMTQPDQEQFVSSLKSAGIYVKDNGKGFAEVGQ